MPHKDRIVTRDGVKGIMHDGKFVPLSEFAEGKYVPSKNGALSAVLKEKKGK